MTPNSVDFLFSFFLFSDACFVLLILWLNVEQQRLWFEVSARVVTRQLLSGAMQLTCYMHLSEHSRMLLRKLFCFKLTFCCLAVSNIPISSFNRQNERL